jgi:hypothetical protein
VIDGNNTPWAAHVLEELIRAHGRATQAWYDSLNAAPTQARRLAARLAREAFLSVSVWAAGRWAPQGAIWEASPEIPKRQVLPLELSRVEGDTVRIRLESIPSFWLIDQVALDFSTEGPLEVTELTLNSARDQRGTDVRSLLAGPDGRVLTLEPGDFAELRLQVPDLSPGRTRTFLLRSNGWYRIHTPDTSEPNVALWKRVEANPLGLSRISVALMNDALQAMELSTRK